MIARVLQSVLAAALLLAAWRVGQRRAALIEMSGGGPEAYQRALRLDPGHPTLHFRLGLARVNDPRHGGAPASIAPIEQAVRLNPWSWRYRYELGRAYELAGRPLEAEAALSAAVEINPLSASYRWRLANFHLRRGEVGEALPHLEVALAQDVYLIAPALDLLPRLVSWEEIAAIWPRETSTRLVLLDRWCRQPSSADDRGDVHHADLAPLRRTLWQALLADLENGAVEDAAAHVDCLLAEGLSGEARAAWAGLASAAGVRHDPSYDAARDLVWNGDFELAILGGGLDWRLEPGTGVTISVVGGEGVAGGRSVRIDLGGAENPESLGLSQSLPLATSGPHRLSFAGRALDLSSDEGAFLEAVDLGSGAILGATESMLGTVPWTTWSTVLEVPQSSHGICLRLRRRQSLRIDNTVSGTLWIDRIRLAPEP